MNHLKHIADMTVEEMKAEIRRSRFQSNDKYIFVSYSHVDCAIVYPVVLGWIRDGYNVYIDLDFVNHGSDENWVTKMNERIEDNGCALVAVFQSKNSAFSYAALLELLTVRSETTTSLHAKKVPVDIFKIENLDDDPSLDNLGEEKKQAYINAFEMLSNNMGESLCKNNKQERELLEDGIISWFDQKGKELAYKSADMILIRCCTGSRRNHRADRTDLRGNISTCEHPGGAAGCGTAACGGDQGTCCFCGRGRLSPLFQAR